MNSIENGNDLNVSMDLSNDGLKSKTTFDGITYFVEVLVDELTLRKHKIQPNQALGKGISLSKKANLGESRLFDKHYKCVFVLTKIKQEDGSFYITITDIQQIDFINETGLTEKL